MAERKNNSEKPSTEQEYWQTLDGLSGAMYWNRHDGGNDNSFERLKDMFDQLLTEVTEKFGVIDPRQFMETPNYQIPPAPEGKIHFNDWRTAQKNIYKQGEWRRMICSGCPFNEGEKAYIEAPGTIPCKKMPGMIYSLSNPSECHGVTFDRFSEQQLVLDILQEAGPKGVEVYLNKKIILEKTQQ